MSTDELYRYKYKENSAVGKVSNIYICESAAMPLQQVEHAELVAGKGIVGDRYYYESGTFSEKLAGNPAREVTLIESEEITAFNKAFSHAFSESEFRRNIVTVGIRLNNLVDKEFSIGDTVLKGIRLCEPCTHLQALLTSEVIPGLLGKGGLRAQILAGGEITTGDAVEELQA